MKVVIEDKKVKKKIKNLKTLILILCFVKITLINITLIKISYVKITFFEIPFVNITGRIHYGEFRGHSNNT